MCGCADPCEDDDDDDDEEEEEDDDDDTSGMVRIGEGGDIC